MGKAQPLDAKVKTLTGWREMGSLEVGDAVASIDGSPSIVTGVFPRGVRQVYRITFSDGRSTECCEDHLWRIHYRAWEAPRVVDTKKLRQMLSRKRYVHRLWIDQASGDFGHNDPLPVDPWVLGALLGDGTLCHGGTPMFTTAAEEMLARMRERVEEFAELTPNGEYTWRIIAKRGPERECRDTSYNANPLSERLRELGLWGVPGHEKYIPRDLSQRQPSRAPCAAPGAAGHRWVGRDVQSRSLLHIELSLGKGSHRAGSVSRGLVLDEVEGNEFHPQGAEADRPDGSCTQHPPSGASLAFPSFGEASSLA